MEPLQKPPIKLSQQLNELVDRKHAGELSPLWFRVKKRQLLRIPSAKLPALIKWLFCALALNIALLAIVMSSPEAKKPVLIGLLVSWAIFLQIGRARRLSRNEPYDFSIAKFAEDWGQTKRSWQKAVRLDVTPPIVYTSGSTTSEVAALRFLKESGELTDREYKAAQSIVDGTFRASRRFARIAVALIAANILVIFALPFGPSPVPTEACTEVTFECVQTHARQLR